MCTVDISQSFAMCVPYAVLTCARTYTQTHARPCTHTHTHTRARAELHKSDKGEADDGDEKEDGQNDEDNTDGEGWDTASDRHSRGEQEEQHGYDLVQ